MRTGVALLGMALLILSGCTSDVAGPVEASSPPPATATSSDADAPSDGLVVLLATVPDLHPSVDDWDAADVVVRAGADDPGVLVRTRVAATPEQRAHGLMEVVELPEGAGMIFVYDTDRTGGFWMKGTLVALDIAWIDAAGRVVATATMTPCDEDPCPSWSPGAAYRLALEVPAGFLDRQGIGVGSYVEMRR